MARTVGVVALHKEALHVAGLAHHLTLGGNVGAERQRGLSGGLGMHSLPAREHLACATLETGLMERLAVGINTLHHVHGLGAGGAFRIACHGVWGYGGEAPVQVRRN